eukprot:evm.model.NODE_22846_length_9790_cov_28.229418.4
MATTSAKAALPPNPNPPDEEALPSSSWGKEHEQEQEEQEQEERTIALLAANPTFRQHVDAVLHAEFTRQAHLTAMRILAEDNLQIRRRRQKEEEAEEKTEPQPSSLAPSIPPLSSSHPSPSLPPVSRVNDVDNDKQKQEQRQTVVTRSRSPPEKDTRH